MLLTKQEWVEWRDHPSTQKFMADLSGLREDLKEALGEGKIENQSDIMKYVGQIQILGYVLRGDFLEIDLEDGKKEENHVH